MPFNPNFGLESVTWGLLLKAVGTSVASHFNHDLQTDRFRLHICCIRREDDRYITGEQNSHHRSQSRPANPLYDATLYRRSAQLDIWIQKFTYCLSLSSIP